MSNPFINAILYRLRMSAINNTADKIEERIDEASAQTLLGYKIYLIAHYVFIALNIVLISFDVHKMFLKPHLIDGLCIDISLALIPIIILIFSAIEIKKVCKKMINRKNVGYKYKRKNSKWKDALVVYLAPWAFMTSIMLAIMCYFIYRI